MTSHGSSGFNEPRDIDPSHVADDAVLVARVRASYASLPAPEPAQIARCTTSVLAAAMHTPVRRFGGSLRPRWWWGAAAAALVVVSVSTAVVRRGGMLGRGELGVVRLAQPVGTTTERGDTIRFDLTLPNPAREVALVGDFNGWDEHATPMVRRPNDGAWSTQVPLPPGRHVYAFVVDGTKWLIDPLAPQVPDEGFGPASAVVVDGSR